MKTGGDDRVEHTVEKYLNTSREFNGYSEFSKWCESNK